MNYADRLQAAVDAKGNACLIGLDPHLDLLPGEFEQACDPACPRATRADLLAEFSCQVIDVVAARVPAVKPQSAFFEVLGADGVRAWERVISHARSAGLIVIGDVKRGDISSTAAAYATGLFDPAAVGSEHVCDAVTLNPFLGADSIGPFLDACRKFEAGLYVLVRTSNPGSADFQRHGTPELSHVVAQRVREWGADLMGDCGLSSVGAVVGATHGSELRDFREAMPATPFLLPGYGAQGAGAGELTDAFLQPGPSGGPRGAIVNSSRGITFAWRKPEHADVDWKTATSRAVDAMIAELAAALETTHS